MRRTNIYLDEAQVATLDELARTRGVSRAELIRQLLNDAMDTSGSDTLGEDLAAIHESFGMLRDQTDFEVRGPDERSRHLERIARQ